MLIAEIGINHNGDITTAKRLIINAKNSGWDIVKFQKRDSDLCVPERYKHELKDSIFGKMTYLEYRHKIEFGRREYDEIDLYCRRLGIKWTSSAFDINSYNFLLEYNLPWIKIPSCAITDYDLLLAVKTPVIISTGMSTQSDIMRATDLLKDNLYGIAHCTSTYPCPPEEVNLRYMGNLRVFYGDSCLVGYSGHEKGLAISVAAAALGADFIERHITLDRNMKGSDHAASLEFAEMAELRYKYDIVRAALGDGVKKVYPSELPAQDKLRVFKVIE